MASCLALLPAMVTTSTITKGLTMSVQTLSEFKNSYTQLPPNERTEVLRRARVHILRQKFNQCQSCGDPTENGKKYCDNACKQKAWRMRQKNQTDLSLNSALGSPRTNAQ